MIYRYKLTITLPHVSFERELLLDALERHAWNQTHAAQRLGITRRVLKLKMDRHGLAPPGSGPRKPD